MHPARPTSIVLACWALKTRAASSLDSFPLESIASLPSCALSCLGTELLKSSCHITDTSCICRNEVLIKDVETCILNSCTIQEALVTKNITSTTCGAPVRNKSHRTHVQNITLTVITASVVLARLVYNALFSRIGWGYDDYSVLAIILVSVPSVVIINYLSIPSGLGRDVWTVPYPKIATFVRSIYALEIMYFLQIALLKSTLLFLFLRIFPGQMTRRLFQYTLIFNTLYGVVFTIIAIFPCQPVSRYWTNWSQKTNGRCVDVNALVWANAAISIVLDVWMLVLPFYEVFRLRMSWRKRIGAALMFFVGTFVTVVSIIRLRFLVVFARGSDPTWDEADVVNWSNIEINVGIICACLPTIRVMLNHAFPTLLDSGRGSIQSSSRKESAFKMHRLEEGPEDDETLDTRSHEESIS